MKTPTLPDESRPNKKAVRSLRRIRRRRILIRREHFLSMRDLQGRRRNQRSTEVPVEVTLSSDEDPVSILPVPADESKPDCNLVDSTTSERDVPETRDDPLEATPIVRVPRLTREQFAAMFTESSSSEEEEDEVAPLTPPGGASNMSSRYHPSTSLGDRMQDTEESSEDEKPPMDQGELNRMARSILEATSPASEADEERQAGPSRQPGPSLLRYSLYNTQPTNIHGQVPIMSPLVLVRSPPFAPCPPYLPCSPRSPPGDVYLHPRPPTPHPPSPSPPPLSPAPRPAVHQGPPPVPVVPAAPAAPAVPAPPDPVPWWIELVQGPHQAASAALLHRYLTLLEFTVDNYM